MKRMICTILAAVALGFSSAAVEFDSCIYSNGDKVLIRMPKGASEVEAVLYTHQNMTEEVLFRSEFFTSEMDRLAIAMVFV
ncbi:MAG: hypothetical protein HUJ94_01375, partial [Bacteroidales bacterium]|nr:hypothetical protein [Bacteroidales bacterium]